MNNFFWKFLKSLHNSHRFTTRNGMGKREKAQETKRELDDSEGRETDSTCGSCWPVALLLLCSSTMLICKWKAAVTWFTPKKSKKGFVLGCLRKPQFPAESRDSHLTVKRCCLVIWSLLMISSVNTPLVWNSADMGEPSPFSSLGPWFNFMTH